MAWFHKTLQDMERAIDREDWQQVKKILQEHNRCLERGSPEIEHDISDAGHSISEYGQHLNQISAMLTSKMEHGANNKDLMKVNVEAAIGCAYKFERTLKRLIDEGKFMD